MSQQALLLKHRKNIFRWLKIGISRFSKLPNEQKSETREWLKPPGNISEIERQIMEEYDVVFKSRESYYQIWRSANLTWQKGDKENPRKDPEKIKERNKELAAKRASR